MVTLTEHVRVLIEHVHILTSDACDPSQDEAGELKRLALESARLAELDLAIPGAQWPSPMAEAVAVGGRVSVHINLCERPEADQLAALDRMRAAGLRWGTPIDGVCTSWVLSTWDEREMEATAFISRRVAALLRSPDARATRAAEIRAELAALEADPYDPHR